MEMIMKFKLIAAACAALCSVTAIAASLNPVTQAPEVTFYIAGASAQEKAVQVVALDLFQTPGEVVKISQASGQKTQGWYGMSKPALTGGTTKRLFLAYNKTNGSNAGVAQVLSDAKAEAEANIVTLGAGCTGSGLAYACTVAAPTEADMALSDVYPGEAVAGVLPVGPGNIDISGLTVVTTAMEGFGIAVNPALYAALQTSQGLCTGVAAACQPSIRRADYASLVTLDGAIKDAAGLLQNTGDTTPLTLARRVDSSGTQAASNIFFANNVCGAFGYKGALTLLGAGDSNAGVFDILENSATGDVKAALTGTTTNGYALGVMSLENVPTAVLSDFKFVKIDGVSPNFSAAGVADTKLRNAMASGNYQFQVEMTAMYRSTATKQQKDLATAVINGLKDSTKHDLAGIAYLDGTTYSVGGKASRVSRLGNNCGPLVN
jgi:hypothetical protein